MKRFCMAVVMTILCLVVTCGLLIASPVAALFWAVSFTAEVWKAWPAVVFEPEEEGL